MTSISNRKDLQTVITTFDVTPGTCQDLLDELMSVCGDVVSKKQGFISMNLHVNDACTRIANYSQWERREDFLAMLRSDEMRARTKKINDMCKSFEPVLYEVVYSVGVTKDR